MGNLTSTGPGEAFLRRESIYGLIRGRKDPSGATSKCGKPASGEQSISARAAALCSRSGFPVCFHGDQSHEALRAASCGLCGIFLGGAVERHSRWNGFPCGSSSPGESEVCPHCCRLSGSGCVPRVAFSSQLCSDRSFTFLSCQGLSKCLVHPILVQTTSAQVVGCCIDTGGLASRAPRLPEHDICRAPRRVFFLD